MITVVVEGGGLTVNTETKITESQEHLIAFLIRPLDFVQSAGRSIKFRKPVCKSRDVILSILRILRTCLKGFMEKLE